MRYPVTAHIIDCIPNPSEDVKNEVLGMIRENNFTGGLRDFMVCKADKVSSFEALKAKSATEVFDYYGSTEVNFRQALEHVPLTGRERVLEIGAEGEYPFLSVFRQKGCACFGVNVHLGYDDEQTRADWPVRVIADMHQLPFADGSFDVVLLSATTHHGAPIDAVFREVARVTKAGGRVININEPIRGVVKHLFAAKPVTKGEQHQDHRDELVHEHEYSIFEYLQAFRRSGLALEKSLFCEYYDQRLLQARVSGVRFGGLAKVVSRLWKRPLVRKLARQPGLWLGGGRSRSVCR